MGSGDLRKHESCSWNVIKCIKILALSEFLARFLVIINCKDTSKIVICDTDNVCFEVSLMYNLVYSNKVPIQLIKNIFT